MFSERNTKCLRSANRLGFTLLEIMAVVVIIGLLVGAVAVSVRGYIGKARQETAKRDLATIDGALVSFENFYGRLPTEEEVLELLVTGNKELEITSLLENDPIDPWGNPYEYQIQDDPDQPYLVTCFGSDGLVGGEGAAKDITHLDAK